MFATSKEMAKIVTKKQNDLIFGRRKTLYKSTIVLILESLTDTLNFKVYTII